MTHPECNHERTILLSPCHGAISGTDGTCITCKKTPEYLDVGGGKMTLLFLKVCVPCGAVLEALG